MKITFKVPFVIIHRMDYTQLKSLRNLLKVIMDMRSDQRAFEQAQDDINRCNKQITEREADEIINSLLTHKNKNNVSTIR